MSQRYYIRTESPNPDPGNKGKIDSCNPQTLQQYFSIASVSVPIQFVKANEQTGRAEFNVEFSGSKAAIYTTVGTTQYFLSFVNNGIYLSPDVSYQGNEFQWEIQQNSGTTEVANINTIPSQGGNYYIKNTMSAPLGQVNYIINYVKDTFGNFSNNLKPTIDQMNGTPRTTNDGKIPCVYTFTFVPVSSSQTLVKKSYMENDTVNKVMYNIIASSNNNNIEDLKMMVITNNKQKIVIKVNRNKYNSVSTPDIVFAAYGRKSSKLEPGFDKTYRVVVTKNKDIFPKTTGDPKISFYWINQNFLIVKSLDTFYLLDGSRLSSYKEREAMTNAFNNFVYKHK